MSNAPPAPPGVETVLCTEAVGALLWCGHDDGSVSIRDPHNQSLVEVRQFRGQHGGTIAVPTAICYIPEMETVWIGYSDGRITVVEDNTFEVLGSTNAHVGTVHHMIRHDDWVFSCSADTFIHRYSAYDEKPVRQVTLEGHTQPVRALCSSGEVLLSVGMDQSVRVWGTSDGGVVTVLSFTASNTEPQPALLSRLHDLSEMISGMEVTELTKHYQHLLPEVLKVTSPARIRRSASPAGGGGGGTASPPSATQRRLGMQAQRRRLGPQSERSGSAGQTPTWGANKNISEANARREKMKEWESERREQFAVDAAVSRISKSNKKRSTAAAARHSVESDRSTLITPAKRRARTPPVPIRSGIVKPPKSVTVVDDKTPTPTTTPTTRWSSASPSRNSRVVRPRSRDPSPSPQFMPPTTRRDPTIRQIKSETKRRSSKTRNEPGIHKVMVTTDVPEEVTIVRSPSPQREARLSEQERAEIYQKVRIRARGPREAWLLCLRNELRLVGTFYRLWTYYCQHYNMQTARSRNPRVKASMLMRGVSLAGVLFRYLKAWKIFTAARLGIDTTQQQQQQLQLQENLQQDQHLQQEQQHQQQQQQQQQQFLQQQQQQQQQQQYLQQQLEQQQYQQIQPDPEVLEVEIPIPAHGTPLTVVVDSACILDATRIGLKSATTPLLQVCRQVGANLVVWVPSVEERIVESLRVGDADRAISNCVVRPPNADLLITNTDTARVLFVQPTSNPAPVTSSTICLTTDSEESWSAALLKLSDIIGTIHSLPTSVSVSLVQHFGRMPSPTHVL